jgi:hypothetical protein
MKVRGVLATCAALGAVMLIPAAPAQADRCQPEELITGSGTSPIPDEDDPRCWVMDGFVYPNIDCDNTTGQRCIETFNAKGTLWKITSQYNPKEICRSLTGSEDCRPLQ